MQRRRRGLGNDKQPKREPPPQLGPRHGVPPGVPGFKGRRRRGFGDVSHFTCSNEKTSIERVRLNSGGYDSSGRYFGHGEPLFYFYNRDSWGHVRARDRADAKAKLRAKCPSTRFYR